MISRRARPSVVAALSRRLADLDRRRRSTAAASGGYPEPAADPEDALRELMVRHLPRALSTDASDRRSRVCALLLGIAGEARGRDIRFLDAFNTWFERVDQSWRSESRWQQVQRAYAEALRATLARLRAEADARDRPIRARARQAIGARRSAPPAKARVLVLADHWAGAWRIVRALAGVPGIAVHTLICNNTATPPLMFAVRQAAAALRTGVRGALALALASWQGRVRISARPLDDGSTLQWLRDERFWIGLHAMGVIYREPVVASFGRGILNAHIGLLPEYRGRSVMEWSVLAGAPTGVSVFFMDAGIDTGREIVLRRTFDVTGERGTVAAKASLFRRDGEMYRAALHALLDGGPAAEPDNAGGRRYFVMSALLTRVVDGLLVRAINDIPWESRECMSNIA